MVWRTIRKNRRPVVKETASLRILESVRLVLVAANSDLVQADLDGVDRLSDLLEARVPDNWPPDLYDRAPMQHALRQLAEPGMQGWSFWYLLTNERSSREVLGICGFKGRADASGSVEIGYSVLRQFRNQGFASEAVERLVNWAFSHQHVLQVCAETLPHLQPSIRVMKKNGFAYQGEGSERGVVRYVVQRPDRR